MRYIKIFAGILLITLGYAFITVPKGLVNGGGAIAHARLIKTMLKREKNDIITMR